MGMVKDGATIAIALLPTLGELLSSAKDLVG